MMPYTVARPRPVPSPLGLVVKNGSNARSMTSWGIPVPVSLTFRLLYRPGASPTRLAAWSVSTSALAVATISFPPPGIASRALTARLTRTCSIWPGSASTGPSPAARSVDSSTCSPRVRSSSCSTPSITWLRFSTRGWMTSRRAKASSWWVSPAARSAARWICPMSSRTSRHWSCGVWLAISSATNAA